MSSTPWQCLATLRDVAEAGLPKQANPKPAVEQRRAILRMSGFFAPFLRKKYGLPLPLYITDFVVTSAAGSAALDDMGMTAGGDAADVRIEVVTGGAVSSGTVGYRVSRDDGAAGTWSAPSALDPDGAIMVDGVTITLAGTWAAGETVTYTAGPDPGVRWAVAVLAAHSMYWNRGADPKAMEPYKDARDKAIEFGRLLANGSEAELDQKTDATPGRVENGPILPIRTRDGFLRGRS